MDMAVGVENIEGEVGPWDLEINCMSMFLFEGFEGVGRRHDVVGGQPPPPKILTYSWLILDLVIVHNRRAGY